jgi:hypothetical protein
MSDITDHGRRVISDCAGRYGLSDAAVEHMARAVANGGGTMAQFNVPELGGSGQWMSGGMTMVGDMFNMGLQARVSNLCGELSDAMGRGAFFAAPQGMGGGSWWPEGLGAPASVGGQNQARYAYFPQARRIAFDAGNGGQVILLDTLDNNIGGFSQQQSGQGDPFQGVSFSSQYGQFALSSLPRADGSGPAPFVAPTQDFAPQPAQDFVPQPDVQDFVPQPAQAPAAPAPAGDADAILATIGRLATLRDAGALTDDEFTSKKSELLARL